MRKTLVIAAVASCLASGHALAEQAFEYVPSLSVAAAFGGPSRPSDMPLRFSAALSHHSPWQAEQHALVRVDFMPGQLAQASIAGMPIAGYVMATHADGTGPEAGGGFLANNWKMLALGGAAVIGLAVAGGGGGGDDAAAASSPSPTPNTDVCAVNGGDTAPSACVPTGG